MCVSEAVDALHSILIYGALVAASGARWGIDGPKGCSRVLERVNVCVRTDDGVRQCAMTSKQNDHGQKLLASCAVHTSRCTLKTRHYLSLVMLPETAPNWATAGNEPCKACHGAL